MVTGECGVMDIDDIFGSVYRAAIDDVRAAGHDAKHDALAGYLVEYGRMAVEDADDPVADRFEDRLDYIESIDDPAERYGAAESWWWDAFDAFDEYGFQNTDDAAAPDEDADRVPYDEIRHILDGSADVTVTLDDGDGIKIDVGGTVTHEHVYPDGVPGAGGPGSGPGGDPDDTGPDAAGDPDSGPDSGPDTSDDGPDATGDPDDTADDADDSDEHDYFDLEIEYDEASWFDEDELPDDATLDYRVAASKKRRGGRGSHAVPVEEGDIDRYDISFGNVVRPSRSRGFGGWDPEGDTVDITVEKDDPEWNEWPDGLDRVFDFPEVDVDGPGKYGFEVTAYKDGDTVQREREFVGTLGNPSGSGEFGDITAEYVVDGAAEDGDVVRFGDGLLSFLNKPETPSSWIRFSGDRETVDQYIEEELDTITLRYGDISGVLDTADGPIGEYDADGLEHEVTLSTDALQYREKGGNVYLVVPNEVSGLTIDRAGAYAFEPEFNDGLDESPGISGEMMTRGEQGAADFLTRFVGALNQYDRGNYGLEEGFEPDTPDEPAEKKGGLFGNLSNLMRTDLSHVSDEWVAETVRNRVPLLKQITGGS